MAKCFFFFSVLDCIVYKGFNCFFFFFSCHVILQLGSRLIELLTETAYVQPPLSQLADSPPDVRPAFRHRFKAVAKSPG